LLLLLEKTVLAKISGGLTLGRSVLSFQPVARAVPNVQDVEEEAKDIDAYGEDDGPEPHAPAACAETWTNAPARNSALACRMMRGASDEPQLQLLLVIPVVDPPFLLLILLLDS
jgi:hypothetical protein